MAYVWRLEDERGRGVYTAAGALTYGYRFKKRPWPTQDKKLAPAWLEINGPGGDWYEPNESARDWVFGFSSLAQLRDWFGSREHRAILADRGIKLNRYSVPRQYLHKGDTQAVFRRSEAKLLGERVLD